MRALFESKDNKCLKLKLKKKAESNFYPFVYFLVIVSDTTCWVRVLKCNDTVKED